MAGVLDGQAVSASVTNAAFLYKNADDVSTNKYNLGGLSIGATAAAGKIGIGVTATDLLHILPTTTDTGILVQSVTGSVNPQFALSRNSGAGGWVFNAANNRATVRSYANGYDILNSSSATKVRILDTGGMTLTNDQGWTQSVVTSALTGQQNNVTANTNIIRFTNQTGACSFTGFVNTDTNSNLDGKRLVILVAGNAGTVTVEHNDANSSANNRIFTTTGADVVITPTSATFGVGFELVYDTYNGKWFLLSTRP